MINPGEKTTFDVIFLPREIGPVSGTLNIYTSLGTLYQEVCCEDCVRLWLMMWCLVWVCCGCVVGVL